MGRDNYLLQAMAVLMHIVSLTPLSLCTLCSLYLTKAYVISLSKAQIGGSRSISYTPVAPAVCFPDRMDMSLLCLLCPAQPDVNLNLV